MTTTTQLTLFGTPVAPSEQTCKLELPFQKSQTIDLARTQSILNAPFRTVMKLMEAGEISGYRSPGNTTHWCVDYDSVTDYCDRLRVHYHISDTRSPRKGGRHQRRRDYELAPFPHDQTITVTEVAKVLESSAHAVIYLIQSGALTAYQIVIDQAGSPWRIYRPSFVAYLDSLRAMANRPATLKNRKPAK